MAFELLTSNGEVHPVLLYHKRAAALEKRLKKRLGDTRVYVFPSRQFVKIGIAVDIAERWSRLRCGNPMLEPALYVSTPMKSAAKIEKAAHEALARYRVKGTEWFRCNRYLAVETVRLLAE